MFYLEFECQRCGIMSVFGHGTKKRMMQSSKIESPGPGHEAELIKALSDIVSLFKGIYIAAGHDEARWVFDKGFLEGEIVRLKKLLQKHESCLKED